MPLLLSFIYGPTQKYSGNCPDYNLDHAASEGIPSTADRDRFLWEERRRHCSRSPKGAYPRTLTTGASANPGCEKVASRKPSSQNPDSTQTAMQQHNSDASQDQQNLRVLTAATSSPDQAYQSNSAVREAFDSELRELAEEIVRRHPSLTQLLLSMGEAEVTNPVHGRN